MNDFGIYTFLPSKNTNYNHEEKKYHYACIVMICIVKKIVSLSTWMKCKNYYFFPFLTVSKLLTMFFRLSKEPSERCNFLKHSGFMNLNNNNKNNNS